MLRQWKSGEKTVKEMDQLLIKRHGLCIERLEIAHECEKIVRESLLELENQLAVSNLSRPLNEVTLEPNGIDEAISPATRNLINEKTIEIQNIFFNSKKRRSDEPNASFVSVCDDRFKRPKRSSSKVSSKKVSMRPKIEKKIGPGATDGMWCLNEEKLGSDGL
eukprot:GHVP01063660.1.p1 GENE.GHVP01063660.1~~GHVP01063660.1.p1  ORF type:complete len:163 (+),score=31.99 GHVP01063660.1:297-785(+)